MIRTSPAAEVAADLMGSRARCRCSTTTCWSRSRAPRNRRPGIRMRPYYFVEGRQTVSFWSPLDPVREASLRCVAGSHQWEKPVLPTRWLSEESFYPDDDAYIAGARPGCRGHGHPGMGDGAGRCGGVQLRHPARRARQRRDDCAAGPSPCGWWATTPAMSSARAALRRPFPGHGMTAGRTAARGLVPDDLPTLTPLPAVRERGADRPMLQKCSISRIDARINSTSGSFGGAIGWRSRPEFIGFFSSIAFAALPMD